MNRITRRELIKIGAVGIANAAFAEQNFAIHDTSTEAIAFHHDHILGTSLALCFVTADAYQASEAERIALEEIERLRQVFSLYDPASELSTLNRSEEPLKISDDLLIVLREYEPWRLHTKGACNALVGAFVPHWMAAERNGMVPDSAILARLASDIVQPGWVINDETGVVIKRTPHPLDLNAGAKGYIIEKAAAAVRSALPSLAGGLINLGGDMFGWGDHSWPIGIQNPTSPADNGKPLGGLRLHNSAVATSGGYQRYYEVDGVRYSHLIDPRSGQPANSIVSATVIAPNSMMANLLATTLCILNIDEGLRLTAGVAGAECLIITATGHTVTSPGWRKLPVSRVDDDKKTVAGAIQGEAWPEGYQVNVALEIPKIDVSRRYRRPYVAVWIEDASNKPIRTLSVWGNSPKWLKDLNDWWKIGKDNKDLIRAVTRATRGPGKYDVVWDGKDDKGNPMPQGTYTIKVEVHREHGKHLRQSGKIDCKTAPASLELEKNEETGKTVIEYRKKPKP